MKYKLVLRKNKFVVVSIKHLKVFSVIGRITSISHTVGLKHLEINVALLSLWLRRGVYVSSTVSRLLDGVENVVFEKYK